ncbi:fluoride efflux transporter CrcB [Cytobacillus spongiae]|uniref:fluoride efflux transporter CrcB n=1 Tax=Cytobacillus spongiae TaxID=2901381 RepID=UPI001F30AD68|nr:fluoride efflux transporter CrcB [Cytobacillus spongiae]UII54304.1 fluoride efflux transporter CrcB [Cytobacillus spongiae]
MIYLYIGAGGAIGSLLRYLISLLAIGSWGNSFPYGTLCANLIGAFLLGWFTSTAGRKCLSPQLTAGIGTGLIGSFTTFSTLSNELVSLIEQSAYVAAFAYAVISMIAGLLVAYLGMVLGKGKKAGELRG